MRRIGLLIFLLILIIIVLHPRNDHTVSQPVKIMAVGDSITEGRAGDYTWRYWLWKDLKAKHVSFDFVGVKGTILDTSTGKQTHTYHDPAFDQDHDGAWGRQLDGAKGSIIDEMRFAHPAVLLVYLGTNDLLSKRTPDGMLLDMNSFVGNARLVNPQIGIVLLLLPPRPVPPDDFWMVGRAEYNKKLVILASNLDTNESRIVAADPSKGFDPKRDTYDGVHLTVSGEKKIAAAFAAALASIGIGSQ